MVQHVAKQKATPSRVSKDAGDSDEVCWRRGLLYRAADATAGAAFEDWSSFHVNSQLVAAAARAATAWEKLHGYLGRLHNAKRIAKAKRVGKSPVIVVPLNERAALSPNEFAAVFGRETTWAYRQIWRGKVKAIQQLGRLLIPRSEIERITSSPTEYQARSRRARGPF